jgi:predicted aspartyl protease
MKPYVGPAVLIVAIAVIGYGLSPHAPTGWQSAPPARLTRTPAYSPSRDVMPFTIANGNMHVTATVGGYTTDMVLDTGAAMSSIPVSFAKNLIAQGKAYVTGSEKFSMANGSSQAEWIISVGRITLGRHTLANVRMSVVPDGASLLFGLPELNSIGKFTIDNTRGQLTFN